MERARVVWPDGTNSTERYRSCLGATGQQPSRVSRNHGRSRVHDEDVPEYRQILVDQGFSGKSKFGAESGVQQLLSRPIIRIPQNKLAIHDNITLTAYWDAKAKFEEQQIAKALLSNEGKMLTSPADSSVAHRNIATQKADLEPVTSSRSHARQTRDILPRLTFTGHSLRSRSGLGRSRLGSGDHHRESISNLLFVRHDSAWRSEREKTERLEAGAIGISNTDFYGFKDVGYPTRLIPDPMMYELHYTQTKTRDYLGNQVKKHPVGDNELSEYNLRERNGGVQQGYQPFVDSNGLPIISGGDVVSAPAAINFIEDRSDSSSRSSVSRSEPSRGSGSRTILPTTVSTSTRTVTSLGRLPAVSLLSPIFSRTWVIPVISRAGIPIRQV